MTTRRSARRIPAIAGAAAIIALVGLSAACAKEEEKAPETSTTTTTTTTDAATGRADREGTAPRSQRPEPVLAVGPRTSGADGPSRRQLAHRGARLANRRRAPTAGVDRGGGGACTCVGSADHARRTTRLRLIGGPFALLLGASTDLGPSHRDDTQLTVELRDSTQPTRLVGWARGQGLSVRWQPGKNWAVVEGEADKVGSAFGVEVHDYRGQRGQLFYASPQQPSVPEELRPEVVELGRILSYIPHHTSKPPMLPLDVPDQGLQPSALRNTYNVSKLASAGFTGKGQTIVVFAFDGFDQADLDSFATLYKLPKFTPTLVGGQPAEPRGETTMDLEVAHAVAPDAQKVVINARPTVEGDGGVTRRSRRCWSRPTASSPARCGASRSAGAATS